MAFIEFNETTRSGVRYVCAPNISATHAFTTRMGGASSGIYESFNLGQGLGDDPASVSENYALLCNALGIASDDIVSTRQVHGNCVKVVKEEHRSKHFLPDTLEADAMVTRDISVALIVFTADCVPILLFDPIVGAIGAVHAGWRGTALNIAGAAVMEMQRSFGCSPGDIRAAIGPSISFCCYETDADVPDALRAVLGDEADVCINTLNGKFLIDLKESNRILLAKAGVADTNISISNECTYCSSDKFWSHRKTGGQRGSQAGIISLSQSAWDEA